MINLASKLGQNAMLFMNTFRISFKKSEEDESGTNGKLGKFSSTEAII